MDILSEIFSGFKIYNSHLLIILSIPLLFIEKVKSKKEWISIIILIVGAVTAYFVFDQFRQTINPANKTLGVIFGWYIICNIPFVSRLTERPNGSNRLAFGIDSLLIGSLIFFCTSHWYIAGILRALLVVADRSDGGFTNGIDNKMWSLVKLTLISICILTISIASHTVVSPSLVILAVISSMVLIVLDINSVKNDGKNLSQIALKTGPVLWMDVMLFSQISVPYLSVNLFFVMKSIIAVVVLILAVLEARKNPASIFKYVNLNLASIFLVLQPGYQESDAIFLIPISLSIYISLYIINSGINRVGRYWKIFLISLLSGIPPFGIYAFTTDKIAYVYPLVLIHYVLAVFFISTDLNNTENDINTGKVKSGPIELARRAFFAILLISLQIASYLYYEQKI